MFPLEFAERAQPCAGDIWLKMQDVGLSAIKIWVPDDYRERNQSTLGIVERVSQAALDEAKAYGLDIKPGVTVMVALLPTVKVVFGERDDIVFHVVTAGEILGIFLDEVPRVEVKGHYELGRYPVAMDVQAIATAINSTQGEFVDRPEAP